MLLHLVISSDCLRNICTRSTLHINDPADLSAAPNLLHRGSKWSDHVSLLETNTLVGQYISLPAREDTREYGMRNRSYRFLQSIEYLIKFFPLAIENI